MAPRLTSFQWRYLVLMVSFPACFLSARAQQAYTFELKIEYYTDVSLICDHPHLNVSTRHDIKSLSWLFPDGTAVNSSTPLNLDDFQLSQANTDLPAYNLTIFKVTDETFGHYTCNVVYNDENHPLSVIIWGINANNTDFAELEDTFEENAIIGGIAAATSLIVIGSLCIMWHFRFSSRRKFDKGDLEDLSTSGNDVTIQRRHTYKNRANATVTEVAETDLDAENRKDETT